MNWQEAERHANKGHMTKTAHFQNLRWRTAAILKTVKSKYLTENIVGIFYKIWCTTADIEPDEILKSVIAVS